MDYFCDLYPMKVNLLFYLQQKFVYPSQTSCFMRLKNLSILIKKVMRYGHILRKDLRSFDELKFSSFLTFGLIFLIMRLNSYPSAYYTLGYQTTTLNSFSVLTSQWLKSWWKLMFAFFKLNAWVTCNSCKHSSACLEQESHALWTNLEDCLRQEGEKKFRLG
jgi:hypothetical protein